MKLRYIVLAGILSLQNLAICQRTVSITIDDIPNTSRFEKDGYQSVLLDRLDALKIPVAIFINEGFVENTDSVSKNIELLNLWAKKKYITLGNHSLKHSRYSTTGIDSFTKEVMLGESISRRLSKKYKKPLKYFRFPFNDLGKNAIQHATIKTFLNEKEYIITPFTIESSDWMYNVIYTYYLDKKEYKKANEIGERYLIKTLEYFDFFETLASRDYQRPIHQIYLCHDSKLNADFLPQLISELKKRKYSFISLEKALTDPIYQQEDNYFKNWGISWLYRWKVDQKDRVETMRKEPSTEAIHKLYQEVLKMKNSKK